MDAVILAGGIPQPNDPLYSYSKGESKALLEVAGKPMIQWVLDALNSAKTIDRVVIIGLSEKARLDCKKPLSYLSNQGRLLDNLKAGTARVLELNPKAKYVAFVSSDIPGITGSMVDWIVDTCLETHDDLYYNVIRRESMESRFPTSGRTYTRLKDMEVCGGDLNIARAAIVNEHPEFWGKLLEARKSPAALASLLGPDIALRLIFQQLTVDDVIQRVAAKAGVKGRAIECPYPEIGMDVDKPHQLDIMRGYLSRRHRGTRASVSSTTRQGRTRPGHSLKPQKSSRPGAGKAVRSRTTNTVARSSVRSRRK